MGVGDRTMLTWAKEAVLGGFGWHYDEIVADFGEDPIIQYHKVCCSHCSFVAGHLSHSRPQVLIALECLWNLSLAMTKVSVLLFYCKVFAVTKVKLLSQITIVFVALLGTSGFLSTMLVCHPFAFNWDLSIPGGYCGSQSDVFAVFGIMNLVTDVVVLLLPIKSLLALRLPLWKKVSLMATFSVGFL